MTILNDPEKRKIWIEGQRQRTINQWKNPNSKIRSKEVREKISNAMRNRIISEETKQKMRIAASKRIVTDETKKRMSEVHVERYKNIEFKNKMLERWRSKDCILKKSESAKRAHNCENSIFKSDEFRRKQREIVTIRNNLPEVKERIRASVLRLCKDPNHLKKMSDAQKIVSSNPEVLLKRSLSMKRTLNNPVRREKMKLVMTDVWNRPKYREKLASNPPIFRLTKPHKKIIEYLSDLNISHISEKYILGHCRDIYCPEHNLVIEVDGDYYHCNPKKYNSTFFHLHHQKTAQEIWDKDKKQTETLIENGYRVLRLFESDINNISREVLLTMINSNTVKQ
jgi:very-short-patch-repair endonuclease